MTKTTITSETSKAKSEWTKDDMIAAITDWIDNDAEAVQSFEGVRISHIDYIGRDNIIAILPILDSETLFSLFFGPSNFGKGYGVDWDKATGLLIFGRGFSYMADGDVRSVRSIDEAY